MNTYKKLIVFAVVLTTLFSCSEIIFVKDISEERVAILAPTNTTTLEAGSISFDWEPVDEATEYQLQIATPNFAQAVQIIEEAYTTTTSLVFDLEANEYEWRVKAINSAYETTYTTHSLTVN